MDESIKADLLDAHARNTVDVLASSARGYVDQGDSVAALACIWIADLTTVQRLVWKWATGDHSAARHETFALWEEVIQSIDGVTDGAETLGEQIAAHRTELTEVLARRGVAVTAEEFVTVNGMAGLPAPTPHQLKASAQLRLGSMEPTAYVAERRRESIDQMIRSQRAIADGHIAAAISHAYDSDMASLDAYLTESAIAAGDQYLFTWLTRWELVSTRISTLPSLPRDLAAAIQTVRAAMAEALGEPDASRLLASLQPV